MSDNRPGEAELSNLIIKCDVDARLARSLELLAILSAHSLVAK